jgi:hypothetical protein
MILSDDKNNKASKPQYTGIIKNPAPGKLRAMIALITIHKIKVQYNGSLSTFIEKADKTKAILKRTKAAMWHDHYK